ncbi:flavin reductase family protein [Candidatus Bathyarchaeota archaeon]|nr:flavin reductase family protein [Candidatus Bathyarchaeota archaeon]
MSGKNVKDVNLKLAYRLLHPRNTALLTCVDEEGRANIITLAWLMPVSINPPLVAVSIAPRRYSHKLIEESGEFVINVPTMELVEETLYCGSVSGRRVDKFKETGLTPIPAKKVKAPAIKECIAHLECVVRQKVPAGDHTLFIGEVVAAHVNKDVFDGRFDVKKAKIIYHVGGDEFITHIDEITVPKIKDS